MGAVVLVITGGAGETLDIWGDRDVRCFGEIVIQEFFGGGFVPDGLSGGHVTSVLVILS